MDALLAQEIAALELEKPQDDPLVVSKSVDASCAYIGFGMYDEAEDILKKKVLPF